MGLRVGIDLDGVVYPFVDVYRDWLVSKGIRTPEECPDPTHWHFPKDWGFTSAEFMESFAQGVREGFIFTEGDPLPGSIEGLHALAERGHELIIITARHVPEAEMEARRATLRWLVSHDVALSGFCISDDKGALGTDIFLEDAEHNYDSLEASGETMPVLFTQPWNDGHPGRRISSWERFCSFVETAHTFVHAHEDEVGAPVDPLDRQDIMREAFEIWSEPYEMSLVSP